MCDLLKSETTLLLAPPRDCGRAELKFAKEVLSRDRVVRLPLYFQADSNEIQITSNLHESMTTRLCLPSI